ncbi:MAG: efflux RND transporter permease subunit, partial [Opitutales bacterium]|nr:efflux RND transporter permease subunit [Opitutales bacterium]
IIIEQEEYLRNLPSLSRIVSTANSGQAYIELEFPLGIDITDTMIRVNNALSQVPSYPENVDEPRIQASAFSSNAFMFYRASPLPGNPRQLDIDLMRDFLRDNVKPRMVSVAGVSDVGVWGGADRQIQVLVDPARLAQRGISLTDVRTAIRARNSDRSGGEIESGKRRYLLRTVGRFDSLPELEQLILARRGDAIIRLADVASVTMSHAEKSVYAWINNNPVVFLGVQREPGSNVIDIKRNMIAEVAAINRDIMNPAGMEVQLFADDARYVQESVKNIWQNLILGALFATGVMYLFLRSLRSTLVGVIGIPICTIAAFLGLLLAERTINVISLAGIAFAIGMTLDNSIVVLESIEFEIKKGLSRFKAAVKGVQQVWPGYWLLR